LYQITQCCAEKNPISINIKHFSIEDFEKAEAIADTLSPNQLHTILDDFTRTYCPLLTSSS
jgi:hypothetical protein